MTKQLKKEYGITHRDSRNHLANKEKNLAYWILEVLGRGSVELRLEPPVVALLSDVDTIEEGALQGL